MHCFVMMQTHRVGGAVDLAAGKDFFPTTMYRNCETLAQRHKWSLWNNATRVCVLPILMRNLVISRFYSIPCCQWFLWFIRDTCKQTRQVSQSQSGMWLGRGTGAGATGTKTVFLHQQIYFTNFLDCISNWCTPRMSQMGLQTKKILLVSLAALFCMPLSK